MAQKSICSSVVIGPWYHAAFDKATHGTEVAQLPVDNGSSSITLGQTGELSNF